MILEQSYVIFPQTGDYQDCWSLIKRMIPKASHYWLTQLVRSCQNSYTQTKQALWMHCYQKWFVYIKMLSVRPSNMLGLCGEMSWVENCLTGSSVMLCWLDKVWEEHGKKKTTLQASLANSLNPCFSKTVEFRALCYQGRVFHSAKNAEHLVSCRYLQTVLWLHARGMKVALAQIHWITSIVLLTP